MPFDKESLGSMLGPARTPERCGFITANGAIDECRNIAPNPLDCFDMAAEDVIANIAAGGTWHPHPGESSNLNDDD